MNETDELARKLGSRVAIRQAILECRDRISIEESKITMIVEEAMGIDTYTRYALSVGIHRCDKSPLGLCCYERFDDPAWDHCIHCSEPHDRK